MRYETLWHVGMTIMVPIGGIVAIAGIVVGLLAHTWLILWIGLAMLVTGIALGQYAILAPGLRASKAIENELSRTIIGQGIRWEDVKGQVFHVLYFTPNASVQGEEVSANSRFAPYATLSVESSAYQESLTMPVLHRLDFLHIWKCFQERAVGDEEELMVGYSPIRFGVSFFPHLALMIGPKGATQNFILGFDPSLKAAVERANGIARATQRLTMGFNPSREVFKATRIYWNPADYLRDYLRNHRRR